MRTGRLPPLAGSLLATLALLAGCGSGGDAVPRAWVNIVSFTYRPSAIEVQEGASVTWTNGDQAPHTATSQDRRSFDTGTLRTRDSKTLKLDRAGTYSYYCTFHRFMVGRVVVK